MKNCSTNTIKYLMIAFNLFFVISGIIIIGVGAAVKTVYTDYVDFLDTKYFSLPNMLIATGALIFLVSFFGCCGAIKESWLMLAIFSVLLAIIFLFEFSSGIAGYVLRDKTEAYLETTLRENLHNYNQTRHNIWDTIQSTFQCCGVDSYTDWKGVFSDQYALPISCCPPISGTTGAFYCNSYIVTTTVTSTLSSTILSSSPASTSSPSPSTTAPTSASSISTSDSTTAPTSTGSITSASTTDANTTLSSTTDNVAISPTITTIPEGKRRKRQVIGDDSETTTPSPTTSAPYDTGCKVAFGAYVKKHAVQIGGCALGLAIVQLLGIAFSVHLVRQLKNGYYST